MDTPPCVVVIQNGSQLGDALCQLSAFRAMRSVWPGHRLILLATLRTVFANLLAPDVTGVFDEVICPTELPEHPLQLARYLRSLGKVGAIFDTRSNLKSTKSWRAAYLVGAPVYCANVAGYVLRRGVPGVWNQRPAANHLRIHRMVELAARRPLPYDGALPISPSAWARARQMLPEEDGPYLGIMPAGAWTSKSWPLQRHSELAARAAELGLKPVYLLGPHEAADVETVRQAAPAARVIDVSACNGDETEFFWLTHAVLRRFAVCVASEGGLGHLAASHGARLITLSAKANLARWRPRTPNWRSLRAEDLGGTAMADITAEAVMDAVADMLRGLGPEDLRADRGAPQGPLAAQAVLPD